MPKIANALNSVTEKLNSAKPGNMEDEKKETVMRNIKRTAWIAGASLAAVTIVSTAKYYFSLPVPEWAEDSEDV